MSIKILSEILQFKRESKTMLEHDRKITASYLKNKVKRKKLSEKFIELIEKINNG